MKNQFLVDLSTLTLTKEQITAIDQAIQKAVASEIAKFDLKEKGKISFAPLEKSRGFDDEEDIKKQLGGQTIGIRGVNVKV